MENLIDERYFWRNLSIPNLTQPRIGVAQQQVVASVDDVLRKYIKLYQHEYLIKMLGETAYAALTLEKAKELFISEEFFISPIANYVFYRYTKDNASKSTPTGEKKMMVQNTAEVSPFTKLQESWNRMVDMNISIHYAISIDTDFDYPTILTEVDTDSELFNYIHIL